MVLEMFVNISYRESVTTHGTTLSTRLLHLDKQFLQDKSRNKVPMNCISPTSCRSYQKKYQKCCEQESKRYWPTRPLQNFYVFIKIQLNTDILKRKMDNLYLWTVDHIPIPSSRVETSLNFRKVKDNLKNGATAQGSHASFSVNFPDVWR